MNTIEMDIMHSNGSWNALRCREVAEAARNYSTYLQLCASSIHRQTFYCRTEKRLSVKDFAASAGFATRCVKFQGHVCSHAKTAFTHFGLLGPSPFSMPFASGEVVPLLLCALSDSGGETSALVGAGVFSGSLLGMGMFLSEFSIHFSTAHKYRKLSGLWYRLGRVL